MMNYLGIDPGKTGALGKIDGLGRFLWVVDMPATPHDLAELLRDELEDTFVVVEVQQSMPKQGVASSFQTGEGYGVILGVLAALWASHALTRANTWKAAMGLRAEKADSRAMAQRLWPEASLKRVKDHGRAEALLLAEWRRRQK